MATANPDGPPVRRLAARLHVGLEGLPVADRVESRDVRYWHDSDLAQQYNVHVETASSAVVVSTGLSLITISLLLIWLGVG